MFLLVVMGVMVILVILVVMVSMVEVELGGQAAPLLKLRRASRVLQ